MGLGDWDDWLTRKLVRPPFNDEAGRKGWLEWCTRAPVHRVRRVSFVIAGWPKLTRPLRIVFMADFHTGSYAGDVERLEAIVAEASSHAPDIALYGGDFVNMIAFGGGRIPPRVTARLLGRLDAPLGRLAVLGNHDRGYGPQEVREALEGEDIRVLGDKTVRLALDGGAVEIVGIHDARMLQPAAQARLAALRPGEPSLVLAHDPYWFTHLPLGPHLMLAGHTHGGQICLPFVGPLRNASWAPMRWSYGCVEEDGRQMYVTAGLGCSGLPLRLGRPPEYAIVEVNGA